MPFDLFGLAQRRSPPLLLEVESRHVMAQTSSTKYFQQRARRANRSETFRILEKAGRGNPPQEGDELPSGWSQTFSNPPQRKKSSRGAKAKNRNLRKVRNR